MDITSYIAQNALILIPALYVVGVVVKNTPFVPDWVIPWVLTVLGVVGGCFVVGFSADGVIQGVLVAGATVLGNQLVKQTAARE